jgi:hypothetical protein
VRKARFLHPAGDVWGLGGRYGLFGRSSLQGVKRGLIERVCEAQRREGGTIRSIGKLRNGRLFLDSRDLNRGSRKRVT